MCSPPANLVPLHPAVGQLSSGPLHSILGNWFYSLEAVTLLANSSLLEYLGFFGEKRKKKNPNNEWFTSSSGIVGNHEYTIILCLSLHFVLRVANVIFIFLIKHQICWHCHETTSMVLFHPAFPMIWVKCAFLSLNSMLSRR